ncbi:hypothetical protein J4E89_001459 [Alternaria sp. Ai002NY15]|nr:hypothetical protein J4E89_001459 [Alternaria sp. Ai002NY15]
MTNSYIDTEYQGPTILYPETAEANVLKEWYQELSIFLPLTNEWTLLDALGAKLKTSFYEYTLEYDSNNEYSYDNCRLGGYMENGTAVYECSWAEGYAMNETQKYKALEGTVFQTGRFDTPMYDTYLYNPKTSLNLTEDMLNDVLAKTIISAISLGTWWDMVPVTTIRYRNTYSFSNPLNLILPYSICLVLAALFAAIAIWSSWRNRVPTTDGGFVQIMMAIRGNTEMERLVLRERLMVVENMSDELKSLKIRYGELVDDDVLGVDDDVLRVKGRRMGFGTMRETVSPRKRR